MSKGRIVTLSVTSTVPTQLVLGLSGVGIERPRRRRRRKPSPWLPAPKTVAA